MENQVSGSRGLRSEAEHQTWDVKRKSGVGGKGSEVGCQGSGDYQIEFHERIFHARGKFNKN